MSTQEDKTKHSPIALSSQDGGIFLEQAGAAIAELWVPHARAEAIVRAINSHSQLIEALKAAGMIVRRFISAVEENGIGSTGYLYCEFQPIMQQINAALKAAEEHQ